MRYFLPFLFLLAMTGCCRIQTDLPWPQESQDERTSELYRFHLERSGTTKLSGLLALQPKEEGMWSVLLDATGVPLVKMLVRSDGAKKVEFCAAAVCDTRLPEVLGKLVDYIYFMPAGTDCPWYAFSCTCMVDEGAGRRVRWERFGPFRLWEVDRVLSPGQKEKIHVRMYFSSVTVQLDRMEGLQRN